MVVLSIIVLPPLWGKVARRAGRGVYQSITNRVDNIVRSFKDIEIPKPNNSASMAFEPLGASRVAVHPSFVRMRLAVQFDNETRLWAKEVRNKRTYARLAAEAKT
jgi:hypothetical protein